MECLTRSPVDPSKPSVECLTQSPDVQMRKYTIELPVDAPRFLKDICKGTFDAYKTNGNGACAIHSVFGVPGQYREYKCEEARQLLYESLGNTYSVFASKLKENSELLDRWQRNVWLDMVLPCIKKDFKESLLPMNAENVAFSISDAPVHPHPLPALSPSLFTS